MLGSGRWSIVVNLGLLVMKEGVVNIRMVLCGFRGGEVDLKVYD